VREHITLMEGVATALLTRVESDRFHRLDWYTSLFDDGLVVPGAGIYLLLV
jgi:hypothetical protein